MFDMKYSEACEFLGVELGSLYTMISRGKLQSHKVQGSRENVLDRREVIRYKYRKQPEKAEALIRELEASAAQAPAQAPETQEQKEADTQIAAYLQFVSIVGDIFTAKAKQEEETRARCNAEIRAVLQPIAERLVNNLSSMDAAQLLMQAAAKFATSEPDLKSGALTERTLQNLANLVPMPEGYRKEAIDVIRAQAKKQGMYTIDNPSPAYAGVGT
jgi:excisionase family DNA binding protein